jgi:acetate kinase
MPDPYLLALNAGSSSLKFGVFTLASTPRRVLTDTVSSLTAPHAHAQALESILSRLDAYGGLGTFRAVGHRFVHGGPTFDGPRRLTPEVLAELGRLAPLDPDHLPAALAIAEAVRTRHPDLPQVACFDTAFHRTMPPVARLVPLPRELRDRGIERYGFHGLSCAYLAEELGRVAGERAARGRVVLAHLGSGSSLTALRDGRSVDTTMGFTPTSGVPMGTRSGDLDPGVLLYLLRSAGLTADAIDDLVNRRSGLLGVSGSSADVRELLAAEATDARAAEALELYCYRVRQAVGALAATLGGLETLVFAGGIGENSAPVRDRIAAHLGHLGVHLDPGRNARGESVVSSDAAPCTVRVIRTDEESVIARETVAVLAAGRATP